MLESFRIEAKTQWRPCASEVLLLDVDGCARLLLDMLCNAKRVGHLATLRVSPGKGSLSGMTK